jgi:endonuclease YncB( thermonuclease family)
MQRFPLNRKMWQSVVLVLGLISAAVVKMNWPGQSGQAVPPVSKPDRREPARPGSRSRADAGGWQHLEGCTLVEHRNNDGDSFLLRHSDGETLFRLYFVDCPEKYRSSLNAERVAEQARDFGLSEAGTVATGEEARDFTLALLRKGPVTVDTRWQPVFKSERRFAFVTVGGKDLAEALVSRGLARIYTEGVSRPGGLSRRDEEARLRQLEHEAKTKHLGAWGRK